MEYTLHIACEGNNADFRDLTKLHVGYQHGPISSRSEVPAQHLERARKNPDTLAAAHYLAGYIIGLLPSDSTRYQVVNGDRAFFGETIRNAPVVLEEVLSNPPKPSQTDRDFAARILGRLI